MHKPTEEVRRLFDKLSAKPEKKVKADIEVAMEELEKRSKAQGAKAITQRDENIENAIELRMKK